MQTILLLEHFGVSVGALSGVLAARGRRLDLFGVLVLSLVTAFGGGSLRDLLAGDTPVAWLKSPHLFYTACITAVIAFVVCRRWEPRASWLLIADAFALAFFTIAGTQKGLALGFASAVAITLGVITGVAGGIIRDVLTSRVPLVFQPEIYLYATAAFAGGLAYCLLVLAVSPTAAMWAAVAITLVLRLSAIRYRLVLPVFPSEKNTIS